MTQHTPGPWAQSTEFGQQSLIGPVGGHPVASVTGYYTAVGQSQANAHLIAAAPDLLAAARQALEIAESWIYDQAVDANILATALAELDPVRAAIAKATGQ